MKEIRFIFFLTECFFFQQTDRLLLTDGATVSKTTVYTSSAILFYIFTSINRHYFSYLEKVAKNIFQSDKFHHKKMKGIACSEILSKNSAGIIL